jgi:hypothetical protein
LINRREAESDRSGLPSHRKRLFKAGERFVAPLEDEQRSTPARPGNRMVWRERERSIEVGKGLGRLPRLLERNAD